MISAGLSTIVAQHADQICNQCKKHYQYTMYQVANLAENANGTTSGDLAAKLVTDTSGPTPNHSRLSREPTSPTDYGTI